MFDTMFVFVSEYVQKEKCRYLHVYFPGLEKEIVTMKLSDDTILPSPQG